MGCVSHRLVVRSEDDDRPPVRLRDQDVQNPVAGGGVELGTGLVGEQHLGPADDRSGHGGALLLPAGQLLDEVVADVFEADPLEGLRGTVTDLVPRESSGLQDELDVLLGGQQRHQPVPLQDEAPALPEVAPLGRHDLLAPADHAGLSQVRGRR